MNGSVLALCAVLVAGAPSFALGQGIPKAAAGNRVSAAVGGHGSIMMSTRRL
jgi:hypothetical protein